MLHQLPADVVDVACQISLLFKRVVFFAVALV
jgi:hypothetical protein